MTDSLAQGRFDGMAIDQYGGRFGGSFDVEQAVAMDQKIDSEVYFVVRARISGVAVDTTKGGDLRRINVYNVTDAMHLDPKLGSRIQALGTGQIQLSFATDILDGLEDDDDPEDGDNDD